MSNLPMALTVLIALLKIDMLNSYTYNIPHVNVLLCVVFFSGGKI